MDEAIQGKRTWLWGLPSPLIIPDIKKAALCWLQIHEEPTMVMEFQQ